MVLRNSFQSEFSHIGPTEVTHKGKWQGPSERFVCYTLSTARTHIGKQPIKKKNGVSREYSNAISPHTTRTRLTCKSERARRYCSACLFLLYAGLFHRLRRVPFQLDRVHVRLQLVTLNHLKHLVLGSKKKRNTAVREQAGLIICLVARRWRPLRAPPRGGEQKTLHQSLA